MKRGESYGGGQSSLGYLFGSDGDKKNPEAAPPPPTTYAPPYGIDINTDDKLLENPFNSSQDKTKVIPNEYLRVQGQNSGNFITDRPSTKVKSVPGGDSSLGYLFGDKE
ncbi:Protein SPIRAL1-like 2 [Abeliophyllum distichum]|uniref:Protein SPIRAL1-like 2 n=1 Tax=Abeliophyllum distichum TaxID=126358 RepID=A0ABD1UJ33_9LAMI